jgi:hypothetical protein
MTLRLTLHDDVPVSILVLLGIFKSFLQPLVDSQGVYALVLTIVLLLVEVSASLPTVDWYHFLDGITLRRGRLLGFEDVHGHLWSWCRTVRFVERGREYTWDSSSNCEGERLSVEEQAALKAFASLKCGALADSTARVSPHHCTHHNDDLHT